MYLPGMPSVLSIELDVVCDTAGHTFNVLPVSSAEHFRSVWNSFSASLASSDHFLTYLLVGGEG